MDDAKLALETLVVGLFGLVWILVLVDLLYPSRRMFTRLLRLFSGRSGTSPLIGLLVLPLAYVVGSVEFPLADRLFNSDRRLGFELPIIESDDAIKVETYLGRGGWVSLSELPPSLGGNRDFLVRSAAHLRVLPEEDRPAWLEQFKGDSEAVRRVRELYDYQKFVVLDTEEGYRLLKPLHDQVVILRGTAFNAFLLSVVCVLGIGLAWRRKSPLMRGRYYVVLPAALVTGAASTYGLMEAEKEYDKHVVGAYYGMHSAGAPRTAGMPTACTSDPGARVAVSPSR